MKKTLLIIIFLTTLTPSYSQTYIKIGDKLMSEDKYKSGLEIVKKEFAPEYTNIEVFEEVNRNDSLIKNARPIVHKNETRASKAYFLLLNKPFPDFKFQGLNNNWYAKSRFLGIPTVVCFIHTNFQPTRKEIKKLNALNKKNQYNVVAFLADTNVNISLFNKMEFPILKDSSLWLKLNFFGYHVAQYMLIDENGIITYFFSEFPDTKTKFKPLNEQTKQIFNLLAN